jgi:c(7)-type cytochrome triheme protein
MAAMAALPPPAFEGTLDPDSAITLLPRDHAGNIDWVAALRNGVIRPRGELPGRTVPDSAGFKFGFDFMFPGPDTLFDAYFPHSTHTQWLNCNTCHARIFPYRGTPIKMGDVFMGRFCGECHGKVSFPVMTGCERCHVRLPMPPNRANPDLIGTITLVRSDSAASGVADGNAAGVTTAALPAAQFPHWVHRSRYLCKSCHMELFVPKAGANRITMKLITSGQACGACHNGKTAFAAGFGACDRCHMPTPPARPTPLR